MTGTLINVAAVLIGSTVGLSVGHRLSPHLRNTLMKGIGLITLVIGMQMALRTGNLLILLGSTLLGGVVGTMLRMQDRLDAAGDVLQRRFGSGRDARFSEAFVTSSIVFCAGPMTILGSIQDGLIGDYHLLALKSALDGIASVAFAASLGPGVLASAGTVLIFQGGLAFSSSHIEHLLTHRMVGEMTAAGGVLMLGIGLNLLRLGRIRVADFLPALGVALIIVAAIERLNL